jgi:hypothetical protein
MGSTTKLVRKIAAAAFAVTVAVSLVGWFFGRDPNQLLGILGVVVAAMGVGEVSNIGKRATFKAEAVTNDRTREVPPIQ